MVNRQKNGSILESYRLADWVVDPAALIVTRPGERVRLELKVMQVLGALARRAGSVVTYEELMDQVWHGQIVSDDSLYRAIAMLRKKLGDNPRQPRYIESIPRVGYRLIASVVPVSTGTAQVTPLSADYFTMCIDTDSRQPLSSALNASVMRALGWSGGSIRAVRNAVTPDLHQHYLLSISQNTRMGDSTFNCTLYFGAQEELVSEWSNHESEQRVGSLVSAIGELIADTAIREVRQHQIRLDKAGASTVRSSYWGLLLLTDQYQSMDALHLQSRLSDLERCIAAYPHIAAAHAALADLMSWRVANGLNDEPRATAASARTHGDTAVQLEPDNPYVLSRCGQALSRIGKHREGAELCRRAHAIAPSRANLEALALSLTFAGDCEDAVQAYCELLQTLPTGHSFQYGRLAVSLIQCGRLGEAENEISKALVSFPREHFCWILRANIEAQLGRMDAARSAWAQAMEIVPKISLDGVIMGIERTYGRTQLQREFLTRGLQLLKSG